MKKRAYLAAAAICAAGIGIAGVSLTACTKNARQTVSAVQEEAGPTEDGGVSENTVSVQSACNIVVIKCLTGMAQAVCAAMDSLHWEGIVGTLAGDDTILAVMQDEACARRFVEELRRMMG